MTLTALQGNATASSLTISFSTGGSATTVLRSGDSIGFGQVAVDSSQTVTVTVKNVTASPVNLPVPRVGVYRVFARPVFPWRHFQCARRTSSGGSTSFTITFAPNQPAYVTSLLTMGNRRSSVDGNRDCRPRPSIAGHFLYTAFGRSLQCVRCDTNRFRLGHRGLLADFHLYRRESPIKCAAGDDSGCSLKRRELLAYQSAYAPGHLAAWRLTHVLRGVLGSTGGNIGGNT